jgi:uncharacterized protein (DUF2225 family)
MAENVTDSKQLKISFQSKEELCCPVCGAKFRREELLSGSGRLIAGELTDELHRLYEKSNKYGDIYPLAYQATVCPECLFASMDSDFLNLSANKTGVVFADTAHRKEEIMMLGALPDFSAPRTLYTGAVSQYLVLRCYDYYDVEFSPTIKQGLAALRASWLFDELAVKDSGQNYDWLSKIFKKKARYLYTKALALETNGAEKLSGLANMGPDTDKNYGYEGMLYLCALLEYKYGDEENSERRHKALEENKRNIAKMFGLGKSSKSRPGPLLEKSKELYDKINVYLNDFDS